MADYFHSIDLLKPLQSHFPEKSSPLLAGSISQNHRMVGVGRDLCLTATGSWVLQGNSFPTFVIKKQRVTVPESSDCHSSLLSSPVRSSGWARGACSSLSFRRHRPCDLSSSTHHATATKGLYQQSPAGTAPPKLQRHSEIHHLQHCL